MASTALIGARGRGTSRTSPLIRVANKLSGPEYTSAPPRRRARRDFRLVAGERCANGLAELLAGIQRIGELERRLARRRALQKARGKTGGDPRRRPIDHAQSRAHSP